MTKKIELSPVPMKTFWGCVAVNMGNVIGKKIVNLQYVADVCRGNKFNSTLSSIAKQCVNRAVSDLRDRGLRPRYPV
jgi:hypothetical protein